MAELGFTVLGGAGFVGQALVAHLRAEGTPVWVPTRAEIAAGALETHPLGHVVYAIGLTADFRTRLSDTVEAHVTLLDRLLNATDWASWLVLSSTRVYGAERGLRPAYEDDRVSVRPSLDAVYDLSKLLGEALVLARPEPTARVARLSNVFGPGMPGGNFLASISAQAARGEPVTIGEAPGSAKDYVPIGEVARLLAAISRGGRQRSYNVASGKALDHAAIAQILTETFGTPISFAPNGALRMLPEIDITRIRDEFDGGAVDLETELRTFLASLRPGKG